MYLKTQDAGKRPKIIILFNT